MPVALFVMRHLPLPAAVRIHDPDIRVTLAFLQIVFADGEGNPFAVRSELGIHNALYIVEILNGQGPFVGRGRNGQEKCESNE